MRTAPRQVSEVLWPAARRAVLGMLFATSGTQLHLREIARRSGLAAATVQREVLALSDAGILVRSRSGQQVYYRANEACPIYAELRGLVLKTCGVAEVLGDALRPLGSRIRRAFVYGSMADGSAGPDSDVDVLIVGDVGLRELAPLIQPVGQALGREVNPVVLAAAEWEELARSGDHFARAVLSGPRIDVVGGDDGS